MSHNKYFLGEKIPQWDCRLVQPLWKSVEFPQKTKNGSAFWPNNSTAEIISLQWFLKSHLFFQDVNIIKHQLYVQFLVQNKCYYKKIFPKGWICLTFSCQIILRWASSLTSRPCVCGWGMVRLGAGAGMELWRGTSSEQRQIPVCTLGALPHFSWTHFSFICKMGVYFTAEINTKWGNVFEALYM